MKGSVHSYEVCYSEILTLYIIFKFLSRYLETVYCTLTYYTQGLKIATVVLYSTIFCQKKRIALYTVYITIGSADSLSFTLLDHKAGQPEAGVRQCRVYFSTRIHITLRTTSAALVTGDSLNVHISVYS